MKAAAALALVVLVGALAPAAQAGPGRVAVGVVDGVSLDDVALAVWQATGQPVDRDLDPLGALVVAVEDVDAALPALQALPGVEYIEPITRSRSIEFVPNDPLAEVQWHLNAIRAFDTWPEPPTLVPVRIAVVDSGIDGGHPEFQGRIAAAKSFVSSKPDNDRLGHGTLVAGEIAAATNNNEGVAGVGLSVELLVAKVVGADGSISIEAEAEAIRWAVDQGARVINLSLGGPRSPTDPAVDTYSPLEQAAIEYAVSRDVVIVAATGNCTTDCPYNYASYPAALPHVIGVSAIAVDGSTPDFSHRDPVFNDLAAPGVSIASTFPRDLTDPSCGRVGYSLCATNAELQRGAGTSFAAPLVAAAATLALAQDPTLRASQVSELIERGAVDIGPPGRDALSGGGRLDVANLMTLVVDPEQRPPVDAFEANDDAGDKAARIPVRSERVIDATVDGFDDPSDVYRVYLRRGVRLTASLNGSLGGKSTLVLWRPGTQHVEPISQVTVKSGAIEAWRTAARPILRVPIPKTGFYFLEVKSPPRGGGAYRLQLTAVRRP
jgi:subtilisin family serine protease